MSFAYLKNKFKKEKEEKTKKEEEETPEIVQPEVSPNPGDPG